MGLDGGINRADWEHPADRMRGSNAGVPVEGISRLVGCSDTTATELVYSHRLTP